MHKLRDVLTLEDTLESSVIILCFYFRDLVILTCFSGNVDDIEMRQYRQGFSLMSLHHLSHWSHVTRIIMKYHYSNNGIVWGFVYQRWPHSLNVTSFKRATLPFRYLAILHAPARRRRYKYKVNGAPSFSYSADILERYMCAWLPYYFRWSMYRVFPKLGVCYTISWNLSFKLGDNSSLFYILGNGVVNVYYSCNNCHIHDSHIVREIFMMRKSISAEWQQVKELVKAARLITFSNSCLYWLCNTSIQVCKWQLILFSRLFAGFSWACIVLPATISLNFFLIVLLNFFLLFAIALKIF